MKIIPIIIAFLFTSTVYAGDIPLHVPKVLDTFYVPVTIGNKTEYYLFDTGAGRMTITQETLNTIRKTNVVTENGQLEGVLGNGSVLIVDLYVIDSITMGDSCTIKNVEVAVLPGATRGLFGLSAIRKAGNFSMSFDDKKVTFEDC